MLSKKECTSIVSKLKIHYKDSEVSPVSFLYVNRLSCLLIISSTFQFKGSGITVYIHCWFLKRGPENSGHFWQSSTCICTFKGSEGVVKPMFWQKSMYKHCIQTSDTLAPEVSPINFVNLAHPVHWYLHES